MFFFIYRLLNPRVDQDSKLTCPEREVNYIEQSGAEESN